MYLFILLVEKKVLLADNKALDDKMIRVPCI